MPRSSDGLDPAVADSLPPPLIRFWTTRGEALPGPREWEPMWVEIGVPLDQWQAATLLVNGVPLPLSVRRVDGRARVVADWPRSDTGRYALEVHTPGCHARQEVEIHPAKLRPGEFGRLLEELEAELPAAIAIAIDRAAGRVGVRHVPTRAPTLAEELARLRVAIQGTPERPGIAQLLPAIAREPHVHLQPVDHWTAREHARRPSITAIPAALTRNGNIAPDRLPITVADSRVVHSPDTYENRVVGTFVRQVELRLSRLRLVLEVGAAPELREDVRALADSLRRARRAAPFLDEVSELRSAPDRITMVLLRRPAYRAAFEAYLAFQRGLGVRLEHPALDAPLQNVPGLYQTWGTLHVILAVLEVAQTLGFTLVRERLIGRDARGVFVRPLPDGQPAAVLRHTASECVVTVTPERTFAASRSSVSSAPAAGTLRSITFEQRPDVVVEITRPEGTCLVIFDPKYKLEATVDAPASGGALRPQKVDIDKMHAYRDAIRDCSGARTVSYAAILYPGETVIYADGIAALGARPADSPALRSAIGSTLHRQLAGI